MIVTIDGPAGAGKSTIARRLAAELDFRFLDTGAMYRAATLAAIRGGLDLNDQEAVAALLARLQIDCTDGQSLLNGIDVSHEIRTAEVTAAVKPLADNPLVRERMVELQRLIGSLGDLVTEGRDQGTVVFPDAECKIYLNASPEERARRRVEQMQRKGEQVSMEETLSQQNERDHADQSRAVGRLTKAADTIEFPTDGLTIEQVVAELVQLVRGRLTVS